ncbi:MAG TPA: LysR family transcriptional regulator [Pseudomonadales bacterium]|nr:LysR family transcriptional regulator [Pseudomonadales bacterium]
MTPLAKIDLNLLISLKYLLLYRQVSRAAEALDLTQSGMSRNLARLRDLFQDDLLVRVGNQMYLTARAEQLQQELDVVLSNVEQLVQGDSFTPETTPMHFRVAAADFVVQIYFSYFCSPLLQAAPFLTLDWHAWSENTLADLEQGKLDFALGGPAQAPANIYQSALARGNYVCISRKNHPAIKDELDLATYCQLGHIVPSLEGVGPNPVDDLLAGFGKKRRIVMRTPHFMSAIALAAHSDLLLLIDRNLAEAAQGFYSLDIHPAPFKIELPGFYLLWHQRHHKNPAHKWLRDLISRQFSQAN